MIYDSTYLIQALKKRVIKIERKNKTEDDQVEIESQPNDKDDKNEFHFPRKSLLGLESGFSAAKWPRCQFLG